MNFSSSFVVVTLTIVFSVINGVTATRLLDRNPNATICSQCDCIGALVNCSNRSLASAWLKDLRLPDGGGFTEISLNNNNITNLFAFAALPNIQRLHLDHNKISWIDWDAFGALPQLRSIDLSGNQLEYSWSFRSAPKLNVSARGTPHLQALDLSENRLEMLTLQTFGGPTVLGVLSVLRLADNRFSDNSALHEIGKLTALSVLDLSANRLETLQNLNLSQLTNLRVLNLAGNQFTVVSQQLRFAGALENLWLDDNPLRSLIAEEGNIFPYIPKLQMLSLVNLTHLRRIGAAALNRLPALQLLYINNNRQLSDIDADAMRSETTSTDVTVSHWPALRELELIGNNLSTIHASLLSMHGWHQLQRIRMHNNPWSCRCARTWLQAELMPAIGPMLPSTIDLPCDPLSSEPSVRGQLLQEVGAFVESGCSERKFDLKSLLLFAVLLSLLCLAVQFALRLCGRAAITNLSDRDGRGGYKKV